MNVTYPAVAPETAADSVLEGLASVAVPDFFALIDSCKVKEGTDTVLTSNVELESSDSLRAIEDDSGTDVVELADCDVSENENKDLG